MLELKKSLTGLRNMSFPFVDQTQRAEHTFHLYDFPETFYLGKNPFKIFVDKENLVEGSQIFIDIIDPKGNSLYYKVSNQISPDRTRTIIVHVYDTTPIGECQVLIAGRLSKNPLNGQKIPFSNEPTNVEYKNNPNVIWKGKVNISLTENVTDIVFDTLPKITYQEKRIPFQQQTITGSRRVEQYPSSSATLNLQSNPNPRQLEGRGNLNTERTNEGRILTNFPTNFSGSATFEAIDRVPQNLQYSVIQTDKFYFTSSMEGGQFIINNITYDRPKNSPTTFLSQSYSGSIVKIISPTLCNIYPPFRKTVNYVDQNGLQRSLIVDRVNNHSNFTASYLTLQSYSGSNSNQRSYLKLRIENAEPELGSVKHLQIAYKELNNPSQKIDLGQYPVSKRNLLRDPNIFEYDNENGIDEKDIGKFTDVGVAETYWSGSLNNGDFFAWDTRTSNFIFGGIQAIFTTISNPNHYCDIRLVTSSYLTVYKDTEYSLEFDTYFDNANNTPTLPLQLDVYISGSDVSTSETNKNTQLEIIKNYQLGQYIGSVDAQFSRKQHSNFNFRVEKPGRITPVFVMRSIGTDIGNIKIHYRNEPGYSPNVIETLVSLPDLETSTEVMVDIEFLNSKKYPAENFTRKLYGVRFEGNPSSSAGGSVTLPSGLVSSSAQIDYTLIQNRPSIIFSSSQQVHFLSMSGVPAGLVSSSNQLTGSYNSLYETRGNNIVSSSAQVIVLLPVGTVSGSDQISGSYDAKYELKGRNIVSSSQQIQNFGFLLTSSYQTDSGSWNTRIDRLTIRTGSYATTSSNQFNGSQTITGSLTVSGSNSRFFHAVSASRFSGSFEGEGSGITGVVSSSYSQTASFASTPWFLSNAGIAYTGKIAVNTVAADNFFLDGVFFRLYQQIPGDFYAAMKIISPGGSNLFHAFYRDDTMFSLSGSGNTGTKVLELSAPRLQFTGSADFLYPITGSTFSGTASYANTALSASHAIRTTSSSYALSASYAANIANLTTGPITYTDTAISSSQVNFTDFDDNFIMSASITLSNVSSPVLIIGSSVFQKTDVDANVVANLKLKRNNNNEIGIGGNHRLAAGSDTGPPIYIHAIDLPGSSSVSYSLVGDVDTTDQIYTSNYRLTLVELRAPKGDTGPNGPLSSSAQVDYNSIQNKINLSGSNQRFLVKTDASSSIAYETLRYSTNRGGSNVDRVRFVGIEQEQTLTSSFGAHSQITFISQSRFTANNGGATVSSLFPVFKVNENGNQATGSRQLMGIGFTIETIFLGIAGSSSNPNDRYVWGSTAQGRAMVTSKDNSGTPYVFTGAVVMSGSTYNQIGTFGNNGGPRTNLDSWYTILAVDVVGDDLRVRHRIVTTSSFNWTIYGQSICRVNKFEYTF